MKISDWIRQKILKFLGLGEQVQNPNNERLTYISDEEQIEIEKIRANQVWYTGDGDEILNYYTNQDVFGFARNPIYNRNKRNYFWGLSAKECNIKRVHSGVPRAIIDTIDSMIGAPKITIGGDALTYDAKQKQDKMQDRLSKLLDDCDFNYKLTQIARKSTLVEGWGAWKIDIRADLSKHPILSYYQAEDVKVVYKMGVLIGVIFKTYYKVDKKDYVLFETRRKSPEGSHIEFNLFKLNKDNTIDDVDKSILGIELNDMIIPGLDDILAVPTKYFYDNIHQDKGRSIYEGKLDLFDDLDQCLSIASETTRCSPPVEYYDVDAIERDTSGRPMLPSRFNRQYIAKHGTTNADGVVKEDSIITTQPQLNLDQYSNEASDILNKILIGVLSPATLGFDIAHNDNALAQREKEKVSILTRNNIIDRETKQNKKLINLLLKIDDYMQNKGIPLDDYDISVKYNEFATPTFEQMLTTLGGAWSQGQISTDKYVDLLWGDKLSRDERDAQIKWLDNKLNMEGDLNENRAKEDSFEADSGQENAGGFEDSISPDLMEQPKKPA